MLIKQGFAIFKQNQELYIYESCNQDFICLIHYTFVLIYLDIIDGIRYKVITFEKKC